MTKCVYKMAGIAFVILCVAGMGVCGAGAAVMGVVVDETSTPLRWVRVQMPGFEDLEDGRWVRRFYTGEMWEAETDENGRFSVPTTSTRRYDLSFDRYDMGPRFLHGVEDGTLLTIVLDPGLVITGWVTSRDTDGSARPLPFAPVILAVPGPDFWYQQQTMTDQVGKYKLRASVVPDIKSKWQVQLLDEVVPIDVSTTKPITGPAFEVNITVKK